jgi:hypothetical protein
MVYFARKGNDVVHHTDLDAMRKWDKVEPEKQLTEAEFLAFDNMARIIEDEIFFGKTPKERLDEESQNRINEIDTALKNIDTKSASRSMRATMLAMKNTLPSSVSVDVQTIESLENQAKELRIERAALVESFDIPY